MELRNGHLDEHYRLAEHLAAHAQRELVVDRLAATVSRCPACGEVVAGVADPTIRTGVPMHLGEQRFALCPRDAWAFTSTLDRLGASPGRGFAIAA